MTIYDPPPKRRRWASCLFWAASVLLCLLIAGLIVIAAAYAGWTSALTSPKQPPRARPRRKSSANANCCAESGAGQLRPGAKALAGIAARAAGAGLCIGPDSMATAAYLQAQPTSTALPTLAPTPSPQRRLPLRRLNLWPACRLARQNGPTIWTRCLPKLKAEHEQSDYAAAIDTLEAIVSIDEDFQRDLVRQLLLDALTAESLDAIPQFQVIGSDRLDRAGGNLRRHRRTELRTFHRRTYLLSVKPTKLRIPPRRCAVSARSFISTIPIT